MLISDPYRRYQVYEPRLYRHKFNRDRFLLFSVNVEESDLLIGVTPSSFSPEMLRFCEEYLRLLRSELITVIQEYPNFLANLTPGEFLNVQSELASEMIAASERCGVGPMAAVAGAIAQSLGRQIIRYFSPEELFLENGGDIFLTAKEDITVTVGAGESLLSAKLGFRIDADSTPLGICSSSGRIGPSLSFGQSDATTVICKNAAYADAWATALGNLIGCEEDIEQVLEMSKLKPEIEAALIILGDKIGLVGKYPLGLVK
ncbi:MAG TPA: UPF0280 family protein [Candidatus Marinimicrobia bacterium]|nr:UPF0280 family protein [Candidatus Neomarinimicrobiota bacterium]